MNRNLSICWFAALPALAHAVDISVGSTKLSIPAPSGFAPITSSMKPYAEMAQKFVPPSNEQFALFLPGDDAVVAINGGIPDAKRKFYIQTTKALIQPFVSSQDFAEIKRLIKTHNDEIFKKAGAEIPGFLEKVNESISSDYNVDLGLAMTQMLPLPPHDETERGLAYSMAMKFNVNDENGKPALFEGVVTTTVVHLQGKVLFLYANAEKTGLEWSRTESKKWANMIIAANPSPDTIALREAGKRQSAFDWSEVLKMTVAGAIIGGTIGLFRYFFRKKG